MKLRTYCLACREHKDDNIGSKKVNMTKKVVKDK